MNYYISPNFNAKSGIAHYSKNFYDLILEKKDYKHIVFSSSKEINDFIINITNNDVFHIEIGLGTKYETEFLLLVLKESTCIVDITLHDPPHIKYPFYEFKKNILNKVSKFIQHYFNYFAFGRIYYSKIRTIYVLNKKGEQLIKKFYNDNVKFMPLILKIPKWSNQTTVTDVKLLYIGFIGKKKGLEYALLLHDHLIKKGISVTLNVIGKAVDKKTEEYLEILKTKYSHHVNFLGYVSTKNLEKYLEDDNIILLPTVDYKYICPTSASVLSSIYYGNITVTTHANAISEIITEDYNGYFFRNNLEKDLVLLESLIGSREKRKKILNNCIEYVNNNHIKQIVRDYYDFKK